jgi:hypothetical protein
MNSPTSEEATKKTAAAMSVDSEGKPAQTAHSKVGIDAERIRSSIARLTSNSTDELEKLVAELEQLQEFLKSETGRVQRQIGDVLAGIGIKSKPLLHGKPPTSLPRRILTQMAATDLNVGPDLGPG